MAAVGIVAISCFVVEMQRRSEFLREKAAYHFAASHQLEEECRLFICGYGIPNERVAEAARKRAEEQKPLRVASEYHHALELKYRAAAARPWLPIAADPPAPPKGNPPLLSADDY
jgi:hypothetical protein